MSILHFISEEVRLGRLTRSTLELWTEIQTTLIKNLSDLSREILRYHDDMVKARKRIRDQDTIDAVNMVTFNVQDIFKLEVF